MALYVSLSLLAVLVALPAHAASSRVAAAVTIVVAALGLVLAHHVAFRLSSRLVDNGLVTKESLRLLGAQLAGAVPVAVVAAVPPLIVGGDAGRPCPRWSWSCSWPWSATGRCARRRARHARCCTSGAWS